MALIYCPECGKEISDKAKSCPYCGYRHKKNATGLLIGIISTLVILAVAFCVYFFFSPKTVQWCCFHKISEATCEEPETCSRCGKTWGEALGHDWQEATCEAPRTCSRCGETKGKPTEHTWIKDPNSSNRICSVCGYSDGQPYDPGYESYALDDGTTYFEGKLGSTMKTAWFDFVITDAYCTNTLGSYTPSNGNQLVVVQLTITNTFNESVPMSNWDFQLQWSDGMNDYAWPIEVTRDVINSQFPSEYTLKVNETRTGYYVYEAPIGENDFSISFVEYYENDTEGDGFWIYFTAQ